MSHDSSDESKSRLAAAVDDSRVVAALDHLDTRLSTLGRGERTDRLTVWGRRTVIDSWFYRWLTTESDPDVIVIDLRETYTVGLAVVIMKQIVVRLDYAISASRSVALVRGLLTEFRAAPIRLVGAAVAVGCVAVLLIGAVLGVLAPIQSLILAILAVGGLAGTRIAVSWAEIVDSRAGQFLVAALEPPVDDSTVVNGNETKGDEDTSQPD